MRGVRRLVVAAVVLAGRWHQAEPVLVGGGAHVGAVAARAERSPRAVDHLPVPRARARSRAAVEAVRRVGRANRGDDANLRVPEPWFVGRQHQPVRRPPLTPDSRRRVDHDGPAHLEVRCGRPEPADQAVHPEGAGHVDVLRRSTVQSEQPGGVRSSPGFGAAVHLGAPQRSALRAQRAVGHVRGRRVEAARGRDAEPRAPLRVPGQGVQPGAGSERQGDLSDHGDADQPRAARGLLEAGRQEQLQPASRPRVGPEERRQDGRAGGLRAVLQRHEHAARALRDPELSSAERGHREPDLPGSLRGPRSDLVRLRGRAEHRGPGQRSAEPAVGRVHGRRVAVVDVRAGHSRRRRLQQDDRGAHGARHQSAQRGHDGQQAAAAVRPGPADAVDRLRRLQGAARPSREAARPQLHVYGVVHAREHHRQREQLQLQLDGHRRRAHRVRQRSEQQRPSSRARGQRLVRAAV